MFIKKKQNKQWGYFKTKISSVRVFRWCIAHANSMCARQVITIQNLCHTWVILVGNFFASHYASLTTKSIYFVWSITLRNFNQFQKSLVFWNQHEKFYLLMKLEENLRWWVDFPNFFGSFDIEWPTYVLYVLFWSSSFSFQCISTHWMLLKCDC